MLSINKKKLNPNSRFSSRNGREAGWQAWSSHVRMRVKPRLHEQEEQRVKKQTCTVKLD